jgi:hypothetical protein
LLQTLCEEERVHRVSGKSLVESAG